VRTRSIVSAILIVLALAPPAFAARTDVIVLRNGDRLTGEVEDMRLGKLQLKTDDAGTVSIEWDKITALTTAAMYEVALRDGTRLLGRLTPGAPGVLQIVAANGSSVAAAMTEIASLDTIKATFLRRIDGSFDLGGSYTKSSGVADVHFDLKATYRRPAYFYGLSFGTNLTRQPDAPETSRYTLQVSYTRARTKTWLVSAFALFEGNEKLGFSFRGTGGLSLDRFLVRSNHAELLVGGGIAAGRERPIDAPAATNVDALIKTNLAVFSYDQRKTRVDFSLLVFPSLNDPGRVRMNAEAKVKREIFHDFFVAVSGYDTFDNRPRAAAARHNDFGAALSFGWTF